MKEEGTFNEGFFYQCFCDGMYQLKYDSSLCNKHKRMQHTKIYRTLVSLLSVFFASIKDLVIKITLHLRAISIKSVPFL